MILLISHPMTDPADPTITMDLWAANRLIDLSLPLEDDSGWAPWWARTRVRYQSHKFGAWAIRLLFGVGSKLLETGLGWANENVALSTHGTTHVDAPWHYAPSSGGQPARTIDEMPLDWFVGPGFVLDLRKAAQAGSSISAKDVQQELDRIGHTLRNGDIVLIQTGCDSLWGTGAYFAKGPMMTAEATEHLIRQGVRLMGIDAWGWDGPLGNQAKLARAANRPGVFWAGHYVGARMEYCHMERLAGLDQLPSKGFHICAFPLKVKRGSAGPARVVAFVPEKVP